MSNAYMDLWKNMLIETAESAENNLITMENHKRRK